MRAPEGLTMEIGKRNGNTVDLLVSVDREWLAARVGLLRLLMGVPPAGRFGI